MRVTTREYLHAIIVLDREINVHRDTGASYVVCPPLQITPAGEQRFAHILDSQDLYVDIEQYGDNIMCDSDKAYDDYDKRRRKLFQTQFFFYLMLWLGIAVIIMPYGLRERTQK